MEQMNIDNVSEYTPAVDSTIEGGGSQMSAASNNHSFNNHLNSNHLLNSFIPNADSGAAAANFNFNHSFQCSSDVIGGYSCAPSMVCGGNTMAPIPNYPMGPYPPTSGPNYATFSKQHPYLPPQPINAVALKQTKTETSRAARVADKSNKGLRHFSMRVLQMVQAKRFTTYGEVADELVQEYGMASSDPEKKIYDQKNIRRRVYDALNVLIAMNIITKKRRSIVWIGLPSNSSQEYESLRKRHEEMRLKLEKKIEYVRDLMIQHIALSSLIKANKESEMNATNVLYRVDLPFTAITTSNYTTVDCTVTSLKDDYFFGFSNDFQLVDETTVVKMLGNTNQLQNGACSAEQVEQYKQMLPCILQPIVQAISILTPAQFTQLVLSTIQHLADATDTNVDALKAIFSQTVSQALQIKKITTTMKSPDPTTPDFNHNGCCNNNY